MPELQISYIYKARNIRLSILFQSKYLTSLIKFQPPVQSYFNQVLILYLYRIFLGIVLFHELKWIRWDVFKIVDNFFMINWVSTDKIQGYIIEHVNRYKLWDHEIIILENCWWKPCKYCICYSSFFCKHCAWFYLSVKFQCSNIYVP